MVLPPKIRKDAYAATVADVQRTREEWGYQEVTKEKNLSKDSFDFEQRSAKGQVNSEANIVEKWGLLIVGCWLLIVR